MAEAVPAERSDAVARLDVERSKDVRERVYSAVEIGVGIAVHAVRDFARDFLAGEKLGGTFEEVGERERVVHHETLHSGILLYDGGVLVFNHSTNSVVHFDARSETEERESNSATEATTWPGREFRWTRLCTASARRYAIGESSAG